MKLEPEPMQLLLESAPLRRLLRQHRKPSRNSASAACLYALSVVKRVAYYYRIGYAVPNRGMVRILRVREAEYIW